MNGIEQNSALGMDRDLNFSTEWKKVAIPKGLPALLEIFAKEVIRENPEDIYEFLYNLAENLLAKREDEEGGLKRAKANEDDESETTKGKYTPNSEELAAAKIQAGFRGYQTRKSLKNSKKGEGDDIPPAVSPSELSKAIEEWNVEEKETDENENEADNSGKEKGSVLFFTDADAKAQLETIKEESVEVGSVSALASVPAEALNKISHMDAIPTADVLFLTDIEDEIMKIQILQSQTDESDDAKEQETVSEENILQTDTETLPNTQAEAEDVVTELEEELAEIMGPGNSVNVTLPTTTDDGNDNSGDQSQTDNDEQEIGEREETAITTEDQNKTETEVETSQTIQDIDDVETQVECNKDVDENVEELQNDLETPADVYSTEISSPTEEENNVEAKESSEQEDEVITEDGDPPSKSEEQENEEIRKESNRVRGEANILDDDESEIDALDTFVIQAEVHNENDLENDDGESNDATSKEADETESENMTNPESAVMHEESIETIANEIEIDGQEGAESKEKTNEDGKEIDTAEAAENQENMEQSKSRPSSAKENQETVEKAESRPVSAKDDQVEVKEAEIRPSSAKENQEAVEESHSRSNSAKENQENVEKAESRPVSAKENQEEDEETGIRPNSAKENETSEEKSESRPSSAKVNQEEDEETGIRPNSAKENETSEEKSESRPSSAKVNQDVEKQESRPNSAKVNQDVEKQESRPNSAKENQDVGKQESRPNSAKESLNEVEEPEILASTSQELEEKPESRPTSAREAEKIVENSESRPNSAKDDETVVETSKSRPSSAKEDENVVEKSESRPSSAKAEENVVEKSESRPNSAKAEEKVEEKTESRPTSAKEEENVVEKPGSRPTSTREEENVAEKPESRATSAKEEENMTEKPESRPTSAKEEETIEKSESRPTSAKEEETIEKSESRPTSAKEEETIEKSESRPISAKEEQTVEKSESRPSSGKEEKVEEKADSRPNSAKEEENVVEKPESRPASAKEEENVTKKPESRPTSAKEETVEKSESRPTSAKEETVEKTESRPSSAKEESVVDKSDSRPNSTKEDIQHSPDENPNENHRTNKSAREKWNESFEKVNGMMSVVDDGDESVIEKPGSRPGSAKETVGKSPEENANENNGTNKSAREKWKESFDKVNSMMSVADDEDIQFIDEDQEVAEPANNQNDAPTNNCDESQISNTLTENEPSKAASPVAESKEDKPQSAPVTPEPIVKAEDPPPPVARARGSRNTPTPTETTPLVSAEVKAVESPVQRREPSNRRSRAAASKYRSGFVMEDSDELVITQLSPLIATDKWLSHRISLDEMEAEIEKEVLNEAATKIQAGFRGFKTRKSLHGLAAVSVENEDPQANNSAEAECIPAETSENVAIDTVASPASANEPSADALPENNVSVAEPSAENANPATNNEKTDSDDIPVVPAESDKDATKEAEPAEDASATTKADPVTETTRMPLVYLRSRSYPGSTEEDLPEEEEELNDDVEMVAIGKVGEVVEGDENDNISVDLDLDEGYINNAATKIQANIRGFLVRKSLKRKGKGRKLNSQEADSGDKTETTEEGADDGGVDEDIADCNSNMENVTNQETDDTTQVAATKIQAGFRGFKDRQKIRQKKQAAVTIQATVRGFLTRRRLAKARRKSLQRRRSSAKSISNELQSLQKANLAATKIQSMYRGYQVRSKLSQNTDTSAGDE